MSEDKELTREEVIQMLETTVLTQGVMIARLLDQLEESSLELDEALGELTRVTD